MGFLSRERKGRVRVSARLAYKNTPPCHSLLYLLVTETQKYEKNKFQVERYRSYPIKMKRIHSFKLYKIRHMIYM